jgi:hypothetical protein
MSNQLAFKANQLEEKLKAYGLNKEAAQSITHKSLLSQNNLGREMTNEIHENEEGVQADTDAAKNTPSNRIESIPNAQNLNTSAQSALANTGSTVETQTTEGCASGSPAEVGKTAAYFADVLKKIQQKKQAAAQEAADPFCTATDVYIKLASLGPRSTEEDKQAVSGLIQKLANVNPVFVGLRDQYVMNKKAEEVEALAAEAGISPEDAAAAMDAAVAANPAMEEELLDEANGEAIADLAGAEQEVGELTEGAQMLADGASQVLGEEVTADQLAEALGDVTEMADEMGVDPMDLIVAAAQEIQQGDEPNDEDMANAQEIIQMAAEQGISPDQIIEEVAASIDADEMGGAEAAAPEEPIEKAASLQKQPVNRRVAYVAEQLRKA